MKQKLLLYRTTTKLGSGQFGCVNKGVWHSPEGPVDVAIKTLKDESPDEELIKFLQEAAIMGQFHHPNIVKLHGVVIVGEPVSLIGVNLCTEYMFIQFCLGYDCT